MSDKHSQEWRSRHEIPNPQIEDAADQYEIGEGPADVDAGPRAPGPRVAQRDRPRATESAAVTMKPLRLPPRACT